MNNSGNTISTDDMIRRVFFNQDYKTDNKALYDALVSKLGGADNGGTRLWWDRSEEHTSELQSLSRISYAVFCLQAYFVVPVSYTHLIQCLVVRLVSLVEEYTANHIVGTDGIAAVVHRNLDEPRITGTAL